MSNDDSERRISMKEWAKLQRRAAYQKAKAQRATDPRYLAAKEAAKLQRREAYRKLKARRQAEAVVAKGEAKVQRETELAKKRAESDARLLELVTWVSKGSNALN